MVLSYHEFLAAGSVSRFPSGQQAAGHRPLAKAFKKQKVDQSPERMERLKKCCPKAKRDSRRWIFWNKRDRKLFSKR